MRPAIPADAARARPTALRRAAADGRPKALIYTRRAAEQACAVMAHESGAALYDRAVALAELSQVDYRQLHELLCHAGTAWYRSGDLERAEQRFDRAADLARSEDDVERLAVVVVELVAPPCVLAPRGDPPALRGLPRAWVLGSPGLVDDPRDHARKLP